MFIGYFNIYLYIFMNKQIYNLLIIGKYSHFSQDCGADCDIFWLGIKRTVKNSTFTRKDPVAANFSKTYLSGGYVQYPRFGWQWSDGTLYDWRFDFTIEVPSMGFNLWQNGEPPTSTKPDYNRCAVSESGWWRSVNCTDRYKVVCEKGRL